MYDIPLFKLNFDERENAAVNEVLDSQWISTGPKCADLESLIQRMFSVKYALSVTNCTAALHLALLALDIKAGDEVIVPSLTFVATANAVRYVGATPVFCDIVSLDKPVISPDSIREAITEKTKAIIVMHYGGFACDMNEIRELADAFNLRIVEDACHGPLSEYCGVKLGTIGDVGCFSFFSNKNISTGEGGVLVTNNAAIYERVKLLRSHGMTTLSFDRARGHSTEYDVVELGYNYRMDDIRAALGIVQLHKLEDDIARRSRVRNWYEERLHNIDKLIIPFCGYAEKASNYIFPVVLRDGNVKKRDIVRKQLSKQGIQTSIHYPPIHRFQIYRTVAKSGLTVTERYADSMLTLPMYGALKENEIDAICENLKSFL